MSAERGFMHEASDGEAGHQQGIELLPHQIRSLAAQNNACSPQVSFEFVESSLSGKGLARCSDVRPVFSPSP